MQHAPLQNHGQKFPTVLKVLIAAYALLAIFILLANNVPGSLGDAVQWVALPITVAGIVLGVSMFGYGVSLALKKENPGAVRILAPIAGLAVGFVIFMGGIFLGLTASESNAHEGGGGS